MKFNPEDLPKCQKYMTGIVFIHPNNDDCILREGDLIQIFAPRLFYHKWVGIVKKVWSENFALEYKDVDGKITAITIDPLVEGFYWDSIKRIKILNSLEEVEK